MCQGFLDIDNSFRNDGNPVQIYLECKKVKVENIGRPEINY